jgi:hypothetical protein
MVDCCRREKGSAGRTEAMGDDRIRLDGLARQPCWGRPAPGLVARRNLSATICCRFAADAAIARELHNYKLWKLGQTSRRGWARNPGLAGSAPRVLRDGRFRGLLRMRYFLMPSVVYLILRSAQRARLEGRRSGMQPFVSVFAQPQTICTLRLRPGGPLPLPARGERVGVRGGQICRPRSSLLVWRSPASQRASSLCASARRTASISATSSGSWVNSTISPSGEAI